MSEMDIKEELSSYLDTEDENTMEGKYLTFRMGNEIYGLPIEHVIEIIGVQQITKVPDMEEHVRGVINLRGQVIPVIDVRCRFDMEPREYDDRTCVMVTHLKGISIGLIVDTVEEVRDIKPEVISNAPSVATAQSGQYIKGIAQCEGDLVITILNLKRLLYSSQENTEEEIV